LLVHVWTSRTVRVRDMRNREPREEGAIDALRDTRRVAIQRGTSQRAGFRTQTPKAERDPTWRVTIKPQNDCA